jgi:hypothetical protein
MDESRKWVVIHGQCNEAVRPDKNLRFVSFGWPQINAYIPAGPALKTQRQYFRQCIQGGIGVIQWQYALDAQIGGAGAEPEVSVSVGAQRINDARKRLVQYFKMPMAPGSLG